MIVGMSADNSLEIILVKLVKSLLGASLFCGLCRRLGHERLLGAGEVDSRYWLLETFGTQENAQTSTDDAELTLFIRREFGESPTPPAIQGPSISQVIERLRQAFRTQPTPNLPPAR